MIFLTARCQMERDLDVLGDGAGCSTSSQSLAGKVGGAGGDRRLRRVRDCIQNKTNKGGKTKRSKIPSSMMLEIRSEPMISKMYKIDMSNDCVECRLSNWMSQDVNLIDCNDEQMCERGIVHDNSRDKELTTTSLTS